MAIDEETIDISVKDDRQCRLDTVLRLPKNHLKYSYLTKNLISVSNNYVTVDDLPEHNHDDIKINDFVTYSLKKKGRWNLKQDLCDHLYEQTENPEELRISVIEKHLFHPCNNNSLLTSNLHAKKKNSGTVAYHCIGDLEDEEVIHKYSKKAYADEKSLTEKPKAPKKKGKGRRRGVVQNEAGNEVADASFNHIRYDIITQSPCIGIYEKAKRLNRLHNPNHSLRRSDCRQRNMQKTACRSYEHWEANGGLDILEDDYWSEILSIIDEDDHCSATGIDVTHCLTTGIEDEHCLKTAVEVVHCVKTVIEDDHWLKTGVENGHCLKHEDDHCSEPRLENARLICCEDTHYLETGTAGDITATSTTAKPISDYIIEKISATTNKRGKRNKQNSLSSQESQRNRVLVKLDDSDSDADNDFVMVGSIDISLSNIVLPVSQPETMLLPNFEMTPVKTCCHTDDLKSENLTRTYGSTYYECACLPRRFCIDISGKVKDVLFVQDSSTSAVEVQAICIFEEAAPSTAFLPYEDSSTVVNIWINGIFGNEVESLSLNTINPCITHSLNSIVQAAVKMFTTVPEDCFTRKSTVPVSVKLQLQYVAPSRLLPEINVRCMQTSEADEIVVNREELAKKLQRQITVVRNYDWDSYNSGLACGICYAWLSDDSSPGFCLAKCQHWFCKSCWRTYCSERIRNGLIPIKCPDSDCDISLDYDILTTLLPLPQCLLFIAQHRDRHLSVNSNHWAWCPNNICGRVIHAENIDALQVCSCVCGEIWCAKCSGAVHWPVSCEDAKNYLDKLKREGDLLKMPKYGKIQFVQVKKCPHCNLLLERSDGCHYMACRCGQAFCYDCGQKWGSSTSSHGNCTPHSRPDSFQKVKLKDHKRNKEFDFYSDHLYERCVAHRDAVSSSRLSAIKQKLLSAVKSYNYFKDHLDLVKSWGIIPGVINKDISVSTITNQNNVVQQFVSKFFEIYYQYHYILEYTYLWLQVAFYKKENRIMCRRIYALTDRLTFMTSRLEDALSSGQLSKLINTIPLIQQLLKTLVTELSTTTTKV